VSEANCLGAPIVAEQRLQRPVEYAERHLSRLAHRFCAARQQLFADDQQFLVFLEEKADAVRLQITMSLYCLERVAPGALASQRDGERPEVGWLAPLREAQAKVADAGGKC